MLTKSIATDDDVEIYAVTTVYLADAASGVGSTVLVRARYAKLTWIPFLHIIDERQMCKAAVHPVDVHMG